MGSAHHQGGDFNAFHFGNQQLPSKFIVTKESNNRRVGNS